MRLLILTQYFWPEDFRINELATELDHRGHQVCVLTGLPSYPTRGAYTGFYKAPDAFNKLGDVEIIRVPVAPRGRLSISLIANYLSFAIAAATLGVWKLRGRSFDAILVNQISPATIGLPGIVLRRLKGAATLLWVQDLWPESLEAVGAIRSPAALNAIGFLVRRVYARMDHILVQSQAFIPLLRAQIKSATPITYLPNWAQPMDLQGSETAPRTHRDTKFNVYYLGNLGEAQDFPTVLDAVSLLAHREDLHWYFIGDGRRAEWIRAQLATRGLTHKVTLPGAFPAHAMQSYFRNADALLVSLKREPAFALTVPSKVQTYLAAGVPILGMLDGEGSRIIREFWSGPRLRRW